LSQLDSLTPPDDHDCNEHGFTFNGYQREAHSMACYDGESYPWLALAEEVGEVVTFQSKKERGDDMITRYGSEGNIRNALVKELGDVLWMVSEIATQRGISMQEVANSNIHKLKIRRQENTLKGSDEHDRS